MDLFNEAEVNADTDTAEIEEKIVIPSHKRKKRTGKKKKIFLISKWQKQSNINWPAKTAIVRTVEQSIKSSQKKS